MKYTLLRYPKKINVPFPVISISCGYNHSMLVAINGLIYTFGRNTDGRLGYGYISDDGITKPQITPFFSFRKKIDQAIFQLYAIKCFTQKIFNNFPFEVINIILVLAFSVSKIRTHDKEDMGMDVELSTTICPYLH